VSIEKSRDDFFTSRKASKSLYVLLKYDVWVEVFDIKCVEMGVQAIEMA